MLGLLLGAERAGGCIIELFYCNLDIYIEIFQQILRNEREIYFACEGGSSLMGWCHIYIRSSDQPGILTER